MYYSVIFANNDVTYKTPKKLKAMRKAALAGLVFVACGFATSAQLSITPKVGFEQSFTSVQYNNMAAFSPMNPAFSPQAAVRMDYLFKKIHGPFVEIATNRSLVTYQFTNPETGNQQFTASQGNWQLRYEAGYQVSSKSFQMGKAKMPAKPSTAGLSPCAAARAMHNYYRSVEDAARRPMMNVSIQPYAGMAFIPNPQTTLSTINKSAGTVYQYNAGNWNTAFISGLNFAFAKGNEKKFVVSLQYLKGIGNMGNNTLVNVSDNKQIITHLASMASAWSFSVGVPINLTKAKAAVQPIKTAAAQPMVVQSTVPQSTVAQQSAVVTTPSAAPVKRSGCCYRRCMHSYWQ
jgi:hypothetical protein